MLLIILFLIFLISIQRINHIELEMLAHEVCCTVKVTVTDKLEDFTMAHIDFIHIDRLVVQTGKYFNLRTKLLGCVIKVVVLCVAVKCDMKFFRILFPLCNLVFCNELIAFLDNLLHFKD